MSRRTEGDLITEQNEAIDMLTSRARPSDRAIAAAFWHAVEFPLSGLDAAAFAAAVATRAETLDTEPRAGDGDALAWAYFKPPFKFVERDDTYYVEDSNPACTMRVMLMWPTHPAAETEAAELETRRLGEVFAAAANAAHEQPVSAIVGRAAKRSDGDGE